MNICAYMCVFLGWFYTSDFKLFTCPSINKVSYLILSYLKYIIQYLSPKYNSTSIMLTSTLLKHIRIFIKYISTSI